MLLKGEKGNTGKADQGGKMRDFMFMFAAIIMWPVYAIRKLFRRITR